MLQVKVSQGTLEGKLCSTYNGKKFYSFEGIPYAKPPVGDLRFKAPQEPESWSGIRDATKPGNRSAQLNLFNKGKMEGSEDCLYLNIYIPVLPAEEIKKLPIIFFVHGGRFLMGYGDYYRPDYYIQHDVILVTINYRLDIFGFLCLDTPEVPGNAGLKDTVMALKWVKNNIKNFNGDDDNITVSGESGAGAVVTSYLTSNIADGLFNKVIWQSGNSLSDLYIDGEDGIEKASKVASYLGRNTKDKKELYDLFLRTPMEDLLHACNSARMTKPAIDIRAFLLPVIEKEFHNVVPFFDEPPIASIRAKRFKRVPVLAALNSDEGAIFLQTDKQGNFKFEENFKYFIPKYLFMEENTSDALNFANKISKFYFDGANVDDTMKSKYVELINDHYLIRDIMLFVEMVSKYQDVFLCRFAYSGNMSTRVMKELGLKGATHGDFIQYLFYRDNKIKVATEKDLTVVNALTEAWCNFAKTGKPTMGNCNLDWQPYDTEKKLCLNVEDEITVKEFPHYERMKFWFDLIKERSKL